MADLTDLDKEIFAYVMDCPIGIIKSEVRKAAREFCQSTFAWVATITKRVVTDVQKYPLTTPIDDTEIIRLVSAERKRENSLDDDDTVNLRFGTDYVMETRTCLKFTTKPTTTVAKGLIVRVSLKPKIDSDVIDADLFDHWREAFEYGARYRIMAYPNKPYTNNEKANFFMGKFWDEIRRCRDELTKNYTSETLKNTFQIGDVTNGFVV